MTIIKNEKTIETTDAVFEWDAKADHVYSSGSFGSRDIMTRTITITGRLTGTEDRATIKLELTEEDRRILKEEL